MAAEKIYFNRVGDADLFKIGRSKEPESRRRQLLTGSAVPLKTERVLESDEASLLERRLHHTLASWWERGEFFRISLPELNAIADRAIEWISNAASVLNQARSLGRQKPTAGVNGDPTDDIRALHKQLRVARAQAYLLEQDILVLESQLKIAIGSHSEIEGIASWRWVERAVFDQRQFRASYPKLYKQFVKVSNSRVFRIR